MARSTQSSVSLCEQGPYEDGRDNEITIVLTGKTGAGKSTLVRSIAKAQVKDDPTPKPVSTACETLEIVRNGVSMKLVDTVGLVGSEEDMRATIKDIATYTNRTADVLIYCLPVGPGARFLDGNPQMMKCLQDEFGKHVWKHCVVVFTFSNVQLDSLKKSRENDRAIALYRQFIHMFAAEFQNELIKLGVKDALVCSIFDRGLNDVPAIVAVPAGQNYEDEVLPGIRTDKADRWMSVLLTEVERSCVDERKDAFQRYRNSEGWSEIVSTALKAGGAVVAMGVVGCALYYTGIGPIVGAVALALGSLKK